MSYVLTIPSYRFNMEESMIEVGEKGRGRKLDFIFVGKSLFSTLATQKESNYRTLVTFCDIATKDDIVVLTAPKNNDIEGIIFSTDWNGGFRGGIDYNWDDKQQDLSVLAKGYVAQGQAGRMGGWNDMLLLAKKPMTLHYKATGRTYGSQPERVIEIKFEYPFVEHMELDQYKIKENQKLLEQY